MFEIKIVVAIPALDAFLASQTGKTDQIINLLRQIQKEEVQELATLADVQAKVTAEDTVIDSAVALITGLAAQVAALAPDQAAIDALAADIQGKSDALAAAVSANTPVAPGP